MRIILIRHGKTSANMARAYCGSSDEALSDVGIQETRDVGTFFSIRHVYTTTLKRAQETARLLFPRSKLIVIEDLHEMCFGIFEGQSAEDMKHDARFRKWVDGGCQGRCPEGESRCEFEARVATAFNHLIALAIEQAERDLVCVVHGGTIMSIMHTHAYPSRPYFDWYVRNLCGFVCEIDQRAWSANPVLHDFRSFTSKTLKQELRFL